MLITIIRTAILYAVIISGVRFMGKRQISDLQTTELVVTMLISDLASMALQTPSTPLMYGLIPMGVLIVMEVILSGAMISSGKLRRLICGNPVVVINNGEVDNVQLRRLRMSVLDLEEALRQQSIFSFKDVKYAIVETNGTLSVLKTPEADNPTVGDIGLTPTEKEIEVIVISDGELNIGALDFCGANKSDVMHILKKKHLEPKDIMMMTMDKNMNYNITKK